MAQRSRAQGAPRRRTPAHAGSSAKSKKRTPPWREVEEREARRPSNRARQAAKGRRPLAVVYDVDGPRVRLGILWFLTELVASVAGVSGLAILFATTAGVAALQTAQCLRKHGARPHRQVAGAAAAVLPVAAAVTTGLLGVAILGLAGVALFRAYALGASDRRAQPLAIAGATVRSALFVGFAAACVVVSARFSLGGAIALLLLAAAYETGDYIIGSGAANPFEGPVAGATAVLVVSFAITAIGVRPFVFPDSFVLGAMAAVLCPLGQLAASAILPANDAKASAVRRLDSLVLLAPAWAFAVGILVK
ncbi:MAG: hypothetical protein ACR2LQ_01240 [Acidimicrobiales bacterium]